ncbi:MAG: DUF1848 domain-containing protein [Muribaculaceae bacterium]|nr:DUF1848 domain-containing protein [Muribaculaceae bacterium]
MFKHEKISIVRETYERVEAVAPIIISASRSTDIPAFHSEWFFHRLRKGYCSWVNPFNQKESFISFAKTRCIVFWSKNPAPLIDKFSELKKKAINTYIQFTLNDYSEDGFEPNIPSLQFRIDTFKRLVDILGVGSVIWRYDPVLLTDTLNIEKHIERIARIGEELRGYVEKLVFSFADIAAYKKVQFNLSQNNVRYQDFTSESMEQFARELFDVKKSLGLTVATCGELLDLSKYEVEKNKCIDPLLMARLFPDDKVLMSWLGYSDMFGAPEVFPKDPGQRSACGCILSKDIGAYNTCGHGCVYCYANTTPESGLKNCRLANTNTQRESII